MLQRFQFEFLRKEDTSVESKKTYEMPRLIEYGSIADRTLQTPGEGTKSADITFEPDRFDELSHAGS